MVSSISLKYDGEVHIATFSSRMAKREKTSLSSGLSSWALCSRLLRRKRLYRNI